jgi:hypothetical protein
MAALGTLVTLVTADTSGFTAGMSTAAQSAKQFERNVNEAANESKGHFSKVGEEIQHLGDRFTSLHGLLAIGLGVHLGRALFTEIHHGIVELGSGFLEAQKAGEGFWESIGDGVRQMAGLATHFEEAAKSAKELAKVSAEIANATFRAGDIERGIGGDQYPFLKGGDAADAELRKALREAQAAAEPYVGKDSEVQKYQTKIAQFEQAGNPDWAIDAFRTKLKEAEEKAAPFIDKVTGAQMALAEFQKTASEMNAANEQYASQLKDAIQFAKDDEEQGRLLEGHKKQAAEDLKKQTEEKARADADESRAAQHRYEEIQREYEQEDREDEKQKTPALRLRGGGVGIGGLADFANQLQRAASGGSPEVRKLDDINKEQEKQTKALDDLILKTSPPVSDFNPQFVGKA